jgi:hypothetical protein
MSHPKVFAHWQVGDLSGPPELLLEPALLAHVQKHLNLDPGSPHLKRSVRQALFSGLDIPHLQFCKQIDQKNHITDVWFDIVLGGMARTNALDETLDVRYLAVGWDPTDPADEDEQLVAEAYRFEVDILDRDGKYDLYMGRFLDPSEGNAQTYTIESVTDEDTIFLSGSNMDWLDVGRKIRLYTGLNQNTDYVHVTLTAVDTGTGEVSFTPAFSVTPTLYYTAAIIFTEFGFFSGSGASSDPNTGRMVNRLVADKHKIVGTSSIYQSRFTLERG